jgi:type 1 glutamine amidotransferase
MNQSYKNYFQKMIFVLFGAFILGCFTEVHGNAGWIFANRMQHLSHPTSPEEKPHIVFLISEDPNNYEAHLTIPQFADFLKKQNGFEVTVIQGKGDHQAFEFPGLEVLSEADLLVVFFRRVALPKEQLNSIKQFLKQGKPLVGIRTANHAFSVMEGTIPDGYQDWWGFVPEILGSENRGYGPTEAGTEVDIFPGSENHFILKGVDPFPWHSEGNVYYASPLLDKDADVLLTGKAGEKTEPVAWTRKAGKSRVFYTSLGYPKDFEIPQFRQILSNGILWALGLDKNKH